MTKYSKLGTRILSLICIATVVFYLYTAWFGQVGVMRQRVPLLMICLIVAFVTKPVARRPGRFYWAFAIDAILVTASIAAGLQLMSWDLKTYAEVVAGVTIAEEIAGGIYLILVLEATRRLMGWPLFSVVLAALCYAKYSSYLSGAWRGREVSWSYIGSYMGTGDQGIFGIPLYVCATMIIVFLVFSSLLQRAGGESLFVNLPRALFGWIRGGQAKIAVVGSGILATLVGASSANVATTGTFTIPTMKGLGYKDELAGAIEASASCGGQIMPPIMGVGAFVMAEILGIPYLYVVVAAIIPAILYFLGVGFGVYFSAKKFGLGKLPTELIPKARDIFTFHQMFSFLIPIGILLYFLIRLLPPQMAAAWALIASLPGAPAHTSSPEAWT